LSLRVPLSQIQSTTYAFYPDESHGSIRRVFTPDNAPHTKRHFCGFCGTPLSHWSEETEDEAEFIYVNIGSLKSDSVERLEEEGLLSNVEATSPEPQRQALHRGEVIPSFQQREVQGNPWFEEMIEGSELGRINRKRGGRSSADGKSKVEWEVVEFSSEPRETNTGTGKRKLDQSGPGRDDVEMNTGSKMGTLADITSKANNINPRRLESVPTKPFTPSQDENLTSPKPRFMSPTIASTKQNPTLAQSSNHPSSPVPQSGDKSHPGKRWMASAARRVGLKSVGGDGIPRSKKEGQSKSTVLTFPDKLSGSGYSNIPDPPQPSPPTTNKASPDKPLPSPPIVQVLDKSPVKEHRSLIDASEKPLHRSSPNPPYQKEEWPILFPEKPTTPTMLEEIRHQDPTRVSPRQANRERYPLLRRSEDLEHSPVGKTGRKNQIQRKEVSSSSLRQSSHKNFDSVAETASYPNQNGSKTMAASNLVLNGPLSSSNSNKVYFFNEEAANGPQHQNKATHEPRQTRTSSLRARLSAGQGAKEGPAKVVGFKEPLAATDPTIMRSKDNLRSGSAGSHAVRIYGKNPSKEAISRNRAPAQFVAGSRRSSAHRRPNSRSSIRSDARAISPRLIEPPRRAPPAVPSRKSDPSLRKSSIPVPRRNDSTSSTVVTEANPKPFPNEAFPVDSRTDANKVEPSSKKLGIFEDSTSVALSGLASKNHNRTGGSSPHVHSDQEAKLEATEEIPKPRVQSKRLSKNAPDYGPVLKISRSADKLIMGAESSNKENQPPSKDEGRGLLRGAVKNKHRNSLMRAVPPSPPKKSPFRPSSNQSHIEPPTLITPTGYCSQEDGVKSPILGDVPRDCGEDLTSPGNPTTVHKDTDNSTIEDPFFDAVEQPNAKPNAITNVPKTPGRLIITAESSPWIPSTNDSSATTNDCTQTVAGSGSAKLGQSNRRIFNEPHLVSVPRTSEASTVNSFSPQRTEPAIVTNGPCTPIQANKTTNGPDSGSYPPRSSSRTQHPDYTVTGSIKGSPTSPLDQATRQLQKEISETQLDFENIKMHEAVKPRPKNSVAHREQSLQLGFTDDALKRSSYAQDSNKSHGSMSKGLMSNFRGLFHKRSSEASQASISLKNKQRPSVTANGSPFTSMSDIHPVHRPTKASLNRSKVLANRSSANSNISPAPTSSSYISPVPTEVSTTTSLAMQILDSARKERSSPKKEKLLELGKIMVDTITHARDAEKSMEEAKQAARKAEVHYILCKKSLNDVARKVEEWKAEVERL
ncbi:MAG: hypothetical protein Q9167_006314, partial [Letrouitia subvulpina]